LDHEWLIVIGSIGVRGREALIYHALCRWWDRDAGRGLGVVKEREMRFFVGKKKLLKLYKISTKVVNVSYLFIFNS